jgi:hypothetical protein
VIKTDAERVIQLLRWLASEAEAGRAKIDLTVSPDVVRPSNASTRTGARWKLDAYATEQPPWWLP